MGFSAFIRQNARWLVAGGLLSFSSSFGQTFFISIFSGEIMATFGLSNARWGAIYGLGTLASAVLMFWAGGLSDRFRAKSLGTVTLFLLSLACLAMAVAPGAWILPFVIFGLRFSGQGMISHISTVAIARWFAATRGKALAISALGYSLGEAMLPLMFVSLLAFTNWQNLWVLAAAISVMMIPILRCLLQKERTPQSLVNDSNTVGMDGRHWTRKQAVRHWLFWLMLPAITSPAIFSTALFFQQVHLTETKGWEHAHFVALFPLYTTVTIAASLGYGWAIDKWGCARLMPLYQIPMALAFLTFGWGSSITAAAFGFVLMGLLHGGGATLSTAFWPEFYGTRSLGAIKALATALMVFGSAVGPWLTGWLIDHGIIFADQMIYYAGYILAVCALTYYAMHRAKPALPVTAAA